MENQTNTNREIKLLGAGHKTEDNPTRKSNQEIYDLYAIWKSLPVTLMSKMSRDDVINKVGIEDEVLLDLIELRTQGEFAEKYDLSPNTLSEWNKKIKEKDPLFEARNWAKHLAKNMMFSLYSHALKKGDPFLYKLFFQVTNGWNEKAVVEDDETDIVTINIGIAKPRQTNGGNTNGDNKVKEAGTGSVLGDDRAPVRGVPIPQ